MGRKPRMDIEDSWHHVMNRGAARRQVFFTQGDGRTFEALLGEGHDEFGVEIHAHCLMGNHFHLLVRCPNGGLSEYMQRLGSMYTRRLNLRLGADGPVFRSRFRSIPIDSPEYLDRAGRYIHRNPLARAPLVPLDRYRWSSHRFYTRELVLPRWLRTSTLLDMHSGSRSAYAEFVAGEVSRDTPLKLEFLDAAITTLLEQYDDEFESRRGLARMVATAMLDHCDGETRIRLEQRLAFQSADAQRLAMQRARRRLAKSPALHDVIDQALDLAA